MSNNEDQIPNVPESSGLDELEELARGAENEAGGSGEISLREIPGLAELESRGQKKSNLGFFTLILLILLIFSILMYHLNNEREKELLTTRLEQPTAAVVTPPNETDNAPLPTMRPTPKPKKVIPKVVLSAEDLIGSAKITVREQGPVISFQKDPELAAVGEAFRKRVEMTRGVKKVTSPKAGTITETARGVFQGFRVNCTRVRKQKNTIRDEIVISTPSKGVFVVKNNILDSLRNTDYEKLFREFEESGIRVLIDTDEAKNIVQVRFRMIRSGGESSIVNEFIIAGQGAGKIDAGMAIAQMEAAIPKEYLFVRKTLPYEDEFYEVIKIFDGKQNPLLFIYEKDHKVWGIQVISEKYKSRSGIGIGNTLGDLRIYYENPKIWTAKNNVPLVSVSGIDGIFVLASKGTDFNKSIFPNSTKIVSIIIGGSPFLEQTP